MKTRPSARRVFLPTPLLWFLGAILTATLVSAGRYLWLVHMEHAQGIPDFMMPNSPAIYHGDFTLFALAFHHLREPGFWSDLPLFNYPATAGLAIALFYKLPHPVWAYLAFLLLLIVAGACLWVARLTKRGIPAGAAAIFVIAFLVSYPFRFELQRANIEGFVVVFTAGAILALLHRRYWIAATLIGIAGAMKIFPIILLGLLLSPRKYKAIVWGAAVAFLANLCSLWVLGPSIRGANRQIEHGIKLFQQIYVNSLDRTRLFCDHSLFTLFKLPLIELGRADDPRLVHAASSIYLAAVAIVGLALFFLVIRKLPLLNQVLILILCAVSLPPVSFDYTLVHLAVPFALLSLYALDEWHAGEVSSKALNASMGLFGVLFADLNLFGFHGELIGPIRAVAIIALLGVFLRHPLRWQAFRAA
jgi:hypothetical protein